MKIKLETVGMVVFGIATAILATIYLAWIFYPLEVTKEMEMLAMVPKDKILSNFQILMDYLTNPFQQVLDMPDFPSSADGLHHFQQVKWLFHLVQALWLISIPAVIGYVKDVVKPGFLSVHKHLYLILVALPLIIGAVTVLVGFEAFFVLFHQILFAGDETWMFDPTFDPVITVLPETFFLHCFLVFLAVYEILFGSLVYLANRPRKSQK